MPYVITVMKEVRDHFGVDIHCVNWDENKKTPFVPQNENRITFYKRSSFTLSALLKFIEDRSPEMIFISGRMDKVYMAAAKHYKQKGIPVISACDNQWKGKGKDKIAALMGGYIYRQYFDYLWVPGKRQFEFGKRVGYTNDQLIEGLYCADVSLYKEQFRKKKANAAIYPRSIVFVGRFTRVKGIDILVEAFTKCNQQLDNKWKLVLVGAGDMEYKSDPNANIEVRGFMSTEELAANSLDWGVFCLPSYSEPWGVVVHEFAAAGLPLVCADSVGAADAFVVEGYNGHIFKTGSVSSLADRLSALMNRTDDELWQMAQRSADISGVIDPVKCAYNFMSVLQRHKEAI
jgi:glycosyltransferase involved in cell wall biosynthesis